uniref:Uncharacterized protein n=1 Tax=Meloidogyne floridensis TaxID=298350 RepID=A0A915NRC2_9BILA
MNELKQIKIEMRTIRRSLDNCYVENNALMALVETQHLEIREIIGDLLNFKIFEMNELEQIKIEMRAIRRSLDNCCVENNAHMALVQTQHIEIREIIDDFDMQSHKTWFKKGIDDGTIKQLTNLNGSSMLKDSKKNKLNNNNKY